MVYASIAQGQVIAVLPANHLQGRKVILNLATWTQYFALYTATLASTHPSRIPEFMAYPSIIAKDNQKYKWPSWIVYDQNFGEDLARNHAQPWAKVNPGIYA